MEDQRQTGTTNKQTSESAAANQLVVIGKLRQALEGWMRVDGHKVVDQPDQVIVFRGQVLGDVDQAFESISRAFARQGYTAFLQDHPEGGHQVVATRGKPERQTAPIWINVVLFLVTVFSVLYVGTIQMASYQGMITEDTSTLEALVTIPLPRLHLGISFAATLMGILITHELSHYFVARRHGSPVSLPFFIPLPVPGGLGTMGAVIVQQTPMRSRRELIDIGAAGPLGGLIVAVPLLILGLTLSDVGPIPPNVEAVLQEGNSLLYLALKYLVFGRILPSGGEDVWIHPVAFAAWAGLLVTMINLLPVGQLDGGHISYALLGRRAWSLGRVLIVAMIVWGGILLLSGNNGGLSWLVWGFLNMSLNRHHPPPLNDATKLDRRRVFLGVLMFLILVALFMPAPMQQIVVE